MKAQVIEPGNIMNCTINGWSVQMLIEMIEYNSGSPREEFGYSADGSSHRIRHRWRGPDQCTIRGYVTPPTFVELPRTRTDPFTLANFIPREKEAEEVDCDYYPED